MSCKCNCKIKFCILFQLEQSHRPFSNPGFRMRAKYYDNANAPADLKSVICLLLCVTVRPRCPVPLAVVAAPHKYAVGASSTTTTQTKRNALNSMGKLG